MNSKIKYILLDLGGVLVPETMLIINKQISELLGINFEELKNYPHCTFNKFVETRDMATAEEFIRSVIKLKF